MKTRGGFVGKINGLTQRSTRLVGVCAFSGNFLGLKWFPINSVLSSHPPASKRKPLGAEFIAEKREGKFMLFIPYGHIQIKSKLKVDEIERRLREQLEPHSIVSGMLRGRHKFFQGTIANGEFKISRIIHYRNSFRPVITGKLQPELSHTDIALTFRLDYVVVAILLFIIVPFSGNFILPIFSFLLHPELFADAADYLQYFPEGYWLKFALSSLGSFLFLYLFVMIPFNLEANKATKYLDELFENQINSQQNAKSIIS